MATNDFSKNTDHNKEITLTFAEQIATKTLPTPSRSLGEREGFIGYNVLRSPYNVPIRNSLFIMCPIFYQYIH